MTAPTTVPRGKAESNGHLATATPPVPHQDLMLANIPIDQVEIGDNVRKAIDEAAINELAASITQVGVQSPIKVLEKPGKGYELVFGQRRLLAAKKAGLTTIPALIGQADAAPAADVRSIEQLVENIQRADLNPIDEAKALRSVLDSNKELTQADLARRLGRSEPWVANSLRLLEVDSAVQKLIVAGKLSGSHAKALVGLAPKTQVEVAKEAVDRGYSAHATEDYVRRVKEQETWRKKQDAEQRKAAEEQRAATARRIEDSSKKIPKDAPIHIGGGYYGNGAKKASVAKLFREAGFTKVVETDKHLEARPKGGVCDCTAWKVEIGYSGGLTIAPACIVKAHTEKAWKLKSKADDEGRRFQERVRESAKALIDEQIDELIKASPIAARILLWASMDWSLNDWVAKHKGDRKKADAWDEISSLSDEDLASEIARFVSKDFGDRFNIKLDWPRIAGELGLESEAEAGEATA